MNVFYIFDKIWKKEVDNWNFNIDFVIMFVER